jgi:hypothetical protein
MMTLRDVIRKYDPSIPTPFLDDAVSEWQKHFDNEEDVKLWLLAGVLEPERASELTKNGVDAHGFFVFSDKVQEFSEYFLDISEYKPVNLSRAYKMWKVESPIGDIICEIVEGAY